MRQVLSNNAPGSWPFQPIDARSNADGEATDEQPVQRTDGSRGDTEGEHARESSGNGESDQGNSGDNQAPVLANQGGEADAGGNRAAQTPGDAVAGLIAHQGEIELLNAKWELSSGRTVEVRLVETEDSEETINPFKEYQKRRANRLGQRFHACVTEVATAKTVYDGEMQLCGWAHTERGKTAKFWLDEEASAHPFSGYEKRSDSKPGSMFMCAFVVLDDDQSAVNVEAEKKFKAAFEGRRLSSQVHLMITSPLFCRFMTERSQKTTSLHEQGLQWSSIHKGEMMTKAYIKQYLRIESLADLDRDETKAKLFHRVFRQPYSEWAGKQTNETY